MDSGTPIKYRYSRGLVSFDVNHSAAFILLGFVGLSI